MTLWHDHMVAIQSQFEPKKCFFVLIFTRILWFFWGLELMLFDITKDAVFAEIFIFSNIFGFPVVNWTPKWIKNLGAFHLSENSKFWRIFQTLFLSYWRIPQIKISTRSIKILECNFSTKYGIMGYSRKNKHRGIEDIHFWIPHGIFRFFNLPLEIPGKVKFYP